MRGISPDEITRDTLTLLFHGNGEIASEYRGLAPMFHQAGSDLLVMDYRGYGHSSGTPTAQTLQPDALAIFDGVKGGEDSLPGYSKIIVMGRSMGSVAACAIARHRTSAISGLIIESGFADTISLVRTLGAPAAAAASLPRTACFENVGGMAAYTGPTLILHGGRDDLIPPGEAETLFAASSSSCREKRVIAEADHNTLLVHGMAIYAEAVARLIRQAT